MASPPADRPQLASRQLLQEAAALARAGLLDRALQVIGHALAQAPDDPACRHAAGIFLFQAGRAAEAVPHLAHAVRIDPDDKPCLANFGAVLHSLGRLDEALVVFQRLLTIDGTNASGFQNLAIVLSDLGRKDQAEKVYRKALSLRPDHPETLNGLGRLLLDLGRPAEAVALHERAIALDPNLPAAHEGLGSTLQRLGRLDEAIASYRKALSLDPLSGVVLNNLATAYYERGAPGQAAEIYRAGIAVRPDYAPTYSNLGTALKERGLYFQARSALRRALQIDPNFSDAMNNLANVLNDRGDFAEARSLYRRVLELRPDAPGVASNLLMCLNYGADLSAEEVYRAHLDWAAAPDRLTAAAPGHANVPDPERRLRVGFVSADFRSHSVAHFLLPLLEMRDRGRMEVFCYSEVRRVDGITARLRELSDHWRSTVGQSDAAMDTMIRADGIDVIVDLSGHTGDNRLPALARKPAPVQVTWLGYPNTTGMAAMDARIVDAVTDPAPVADRLSRERLIRLKDGFLCYAPPADAPEVGPVPALSRGYVTFGSFNNLAKMTPEVVRVWSRILAETPGSRLLLKSRPLADEGTRRDVEAQFARHGIDPARLDLLGHIPHRDGHLGAYGQVDLALDPFPYNGTTTTCEALWMGVPVLTLEGERHAGRVGVSLLRGLGLDRLVAPDEAAYAAMARSLAGNLQELATLRAGLRSRMAAAPLCDARGFASRMEAALRDLWRGWCARAGRRPQAAGSTSGGAAAEAPDGQSSPSDAFTRGVALAQTGDAAGALAVLEPMLAQVPGHPDVLNGVGFCLRRLGRLAEAEAAFRQALAVDDAHASALSNLSVVLMGRGDIEEAETLLRRALAAAPGDLAALVNLGKALHARGCYAEGEAALRQALAIRPGLAEAERNLSEFVLLRGDLPEGFRLYEARLNLPDHGLVLDRARLRCPRWDGTSLAGRTLLAITEQGFGDTLQFLRYGALVRAAGGRMVMTCQPQLERLLRGAGVLDGLLCNGDPMPACDFHVPLLSLPRAFGTRLETVPADIPYLRTDPSWAAPWAERLGPRMRPRIGLVWSGSTAHLNDRNRSMTAASLAPLLSDRRFEFLGVQVGVRAGDQAFLAAHPEFRQMGEHVRDFADSAALIEQLDLLVSVDTSAAHLAGALGRPVWTLLPYVPDWRWMLGGETTPWYPTMRLFRQSRAGDWDAVVAAVARALDGLAPRG
ncbi:tetratricopeptide repeat protein [Arenibaculum pallidiluteum]|uniref:tetratricopeptide repeat protein n=1 Tax=Arenibaculum pallidiluteum TaxID=2812559 RepID=UPI001A96E592|nr:tetratricopeptide repeat protein [Arenibaculum pallidiluteum]